MNPEKFYIPRASHVGAFHGTPTFSNFDSSFSGISGSEDHSRKRIRRGRILSILTGLLLAAVPLHVHSQPTVTDPKLAVRTVVSGLTQPINMGFLKANDFFVTEKSTGQVKRVVNGVVVATVLDLPVNFASERGLLGLALHPDFERNKWVYLYWTESSTGMDSNVLAEVGNPNSPYPPGTPQPFGNRVDRFVWDRRAQKLRFDRNIIMLHAYQADPGQPLRGNHNGGLIRFETTDDHSRSWWWRKDRREKLFVIIGDNGRRGMLQNLLQGANGPGVPDDQFGGPEPDNAHLTGVVLRLNDDGSTPRDNPFFEYGATVGGEEGANFQRIFAYGVRNSFGLAVDPKTGELWESENGDDSFDEINRIEPGHNGGWIQAMGPLMRVTDFKAIETTFPTPPGALQQLRWPPANIADSPIVARSRMVDIPGSHYGDPQFSWKYATAPAAIGFMTDRSLGSAYEGDLFVGASTPVLAAGYLFRFKLTENRQRLAWTDPRLADLVADNTAKFNATESESLMFGSGFGVGTDIQTGPNGNLFVVSSSAGAVYEIYRP
ncbi:MAG: PQQ-dependent sugar dehydrogenase [Nibricoccus sp.]